MNKLLEYIKVSKLFVLLNYIAILIGLLNTYFRPKFFEKYFSESSFAFLTIAYGLSLYLAFFDGGISKPLYAKLREDYVSKTEEYKGLIKQAYSFYTIVLIIALVGFCLTLIILLNVSGNSLSTALVLLIAMNLVFNFQLQNLKNLLIAVNKYEFFQKIEVFRRVSNLLLILSLFIDKSFILGNLTANIILIFLIGLAYKNEDFFVKKFNWRDGILIYKNLFKKSKNFFLFTINEILIYNSGFILIPIFYEKIDIIMYGLLLTVYNGVAIFSRSVIDISIHEMTKTFLENKKKQSRKIFNYSLMFSFVVTLLLFGFIYLFSDKIFEIWVGKKYMFNDIMFLGVFIFLIGNVVQHISGTFLLSIRNNYKTMMKISTIILVFMLVLQGVLCSLKISLGSFFLLTSIVYFLGSFLYLLKSKRLYTNKDFLI